MKQTRALSLSVPSVVSVAQPGGRFFQYRGFILLVFMVLTIWLNSSFLKPLVMGGIFAVVLFPLMGKFDNWRPAARLSATWRASIITITFTLLILIPVGLLVFVGVQAAAAKMQELDVGDLMAGPLNFKTFVNEFGLNSFVSKVYAAFPMNEQQFQSYATKGLAAATAFAGAILQDLITSLPGVAFSNLVLVLTIFFLLIDGPKAVRFVKQNSIFNAPQTDRIIRTTSALCNSVIVATIISGAVQSAIVGLICIFSGTSNVLLVVFVTFVTSFLPLIGTAPAILFLAIQAFYSGQTTLGFIWLFTIVIVGISDNIVRPYVIKGGAKLHPMIGFVAAFGALNMIGFYGLFIGPIVAGLFFTLLPMITRTYPRSPRAIH